MDTLTREGPPETTPQFPAEMEAQLSNKNLPQKSNSAAKINDCLKDPLPGTSRCCNYCSSSELKDPNSFSGAERADVASLHSGESFVCRICQNNEDPEKLISPCCCKGSLTYVHNDCLERWISMSRCTVCELCQFQYNTEETLRYTFYQSLRLWYSRSLSRRALQEDCQMFLLLTLIAFGIVATLLVAVQYYILQGHISGLGRVWTKGWLIFFLFTTLIVYLINVYMIFKSQLMPWYRWWQSARDIRLVLENHQPTYASLKQMKNDKNAHPSTAAKEESINQAAKMCCRQQNLGTGRKNDELQPDMQQFCPGVDAPCQNMRISLKNLCVKSTNMYKNQLEIGKDRNKLQLDLFAPGGPAGKNDQMEPTYDNLTLTV